MKKVIVVCLMAFISVVAFAEKQTVTLHVPGMECNTCKGKVEKVLAYEKGVIKLDYNVETRTVVIAFNDKRTSTVKLQEALVKYLKFESTVQTKAAEGKKPACSPSCAGHNH